MGDYKLSDERKAIIASRGKALLVSAGAGSGKTTILVKRLMGRVNPPIGGEAPIGIDHFLIITFTKAAAGELRAKISEAISKAAAEENMLVQRDRRLHLKKQNALVPSAHIGTIHSFCTTVLREYGSIVGLRPGFKVIETEKAESLKNTVLNRVLEKHYADPESLPGFIAMADSLGNGRDDRKLVKVIFELYNKMQCHARPELWAERQKEVFAGTFEDPSETAWGREILSYYHEAAIYYADKAGKLEEQAIAAGEPYSQNVEIFSILREKAKLLALKSDINHGGSWKEIAAVTDFKNPTFKSLKKAEDQTLAEYLKEEKTKVADGIKEICAAFPGDVDEIKSDMLKTAPVMKALLEVTVEFGREYQKEKRENSLVDFSDLEHYAAEILTNPDGSPTDVAVEVSKRFAEIMVDEYQDVSPVQDTIFKAVSNGGKNLFFVGDIKQSIYRFRLADPGIFMQKRDEYKDWTDPEAQEIKIPLKENFRSRKSVVNAVNSIFSTCMSQQLGDVDYMASGEAMVYGSENYAGEAPVPELIVIQEPDKKENADAPDKLRFEAKVVADKIKNLVEGKTQVTANDEKTATRPVEYSDIAILLRAVKGNDTIFRQALETEGIPVNSESETGYFTSPEITELMSLLSIADNPHKDVPLIATLTSPYFGFTADELAKIRALKPEADLYDALCAASETDGHCSEFLDFLNTLRSDAVKMTVTELVWHTVCRTDMLALCSASSNGELKRARILKFIELSQKFEDSGYKGLHQFVIWTRRLKEKDESPKISSSVERGVTIMSIHKSKGLEFPVVFLCNTAKKFNEMDSRTDILIHPELGLGPKCIDLERKASYSTPERKAIGLRLKRENRSEEMRLLYVALTRAKEQLYITGTVDNLEKTWEKLIGLEVSGETSPEELMDKDNMLDWLITAAVLDDGENIKLTRVDYETYSHTPEEEKTEAVYEESAEDTAMLQKQLEENLSFVYPYQNAGNLPSKLTATEIKDLVDPEDEAEKLIKPIYTKRPNSFRMPDFTAKEKPLSAAERGTATHAVLQYIDFSKTNTAEEIDREIERISERGFITAREAEAVNRSSLLALFNSDLGNCLKNAGKVRREFRFSLLSDAEKLLKTGGEEQILLQGVVDCLIEEPDGIIIIDYKTDKVQTDEEINARAEHYSAQIEAYSMAMERIFSKPVKESVLFFLTPGKTITVK